MADGNNHQNSEEDSDEEFNPIKTLLHSEEEENTNKPSPLEHQRYNLQSINSSISIRQLPSEGLSFQLWPAATTLINLLDSHHSHPTISAGKNRLRILELGSGTGAVGIAAAALLGARVTITDLPHVLPNIRFNVALNSEALKIRGGAVDVSALAWGESEDMEAIGNEFDLILGSDVVYHDHLYEPLLKTLKFFMLEKKKKKRTSFVMAHLRRWKKESVFFKKAKKVFDVEVVHHDPPLDGSRVGVAVYVFVAKTGLNSNSTALS